jgi:hypothetical protein
MTCTDQAVPIAIHIVGAAVYAILGAFQLSITIQRRWSVWHRISGRVVLAGGLLVAVSALWLTG